MYTEHWNIKAVPFLAAFDQRYYYPGTQYDEAIARFRFLAESGRLAGLLAGPPGIGKTTIIREICRGVSKQSLAAIYIDAPPGGSLELMNHLSARLNIGAGPYDSLADAMLDVPYRISRSQENFNRTLLCIDDAHNLVDDQNLQLIRFLIDLHIPSKRSKPEQPLFTVLLSGHTNLIAAVRKNQSLVERIQLIYTLEPLSKEENTAYIQQHIRAVGGDIWIYDQEALDALYEYGKGIPRRINLLCDTSLMLGFAARADRVDKAIVTQAATDTGIAEAPSAETDGERK